MVSQNPMPNKSYVQMMAEYNRWINQKMYAVCAPIPDAERKADKQAFFKSIHNTLNHLLWADRMWLKRFTGKDYFLTNMGKPLYDDFQILRTEREKMDEEIVEWGVQVKEDWLKGTITFESVSYKKVFTLPVKVAVVQMFNHQTHHRGQVTTLLSQMGVDYGSTDVPLMPGMEKY
jgi:uncharacterized damage-inducible protein DinB